MRVVIVVSHPIQHFCPQYRSISQREDVELIVVFDSMKGVEEYHDKDFGRTVQWGSQLVTGFEWIDLDSSELSLSETLNQCAPDWLIIYGYSSSISRRAWRWATSHVVRLAYISDSELRHRHSRLKFALKRVALKTLFRRVDLFLSVGDANTEYYRNMGARDATITRMHFPIDTHEFDSARVDPKVSTGLRSDLNISASAVVITMVGKFIERKRQQDLIDACRRFTGDQAHLLLIGSGPDQDKLRESARSAGNVTVVGFVPPSNLSAYYDLTDIYAHVSSYDPHPLAVSEALASGCSLIVSSSTGSWGPNDDVREFRNGLVVETENPKLLHDALAILIHNPAMREDFSLASREMSEEHQSLAHGGFIDAMIKLTPETQSPAPLARLLRRQPNDS